MSDRSTLKSISEKLNISISTVSRALKDHPDISDDTKKKVKELAVLMEYEPNAYAVNLRTNISKVIGLIVPYISNFFYESVIAAIEEEARKAGYTVMILQSANNDVIENENLKLCRQNRVAGILICATAKSNKTNNYKNYYDSKIPLIFFDNVPDDELFDKVCLADKEAAAMAVSEIIKFKRKNVLAIFGNSELSITKLRLDSFLKSFKSKAPEVVIKIKYAESSMQASEIVSECLGKKNAIDQLFCMSDEILIGAIKKLNELQIMIPDDISVIALSNGSIPELCKPSITYIETNGYKLGKLAIQRLFDHFSGPTQVRTIIQPSVLIPGKSM